MHVTRVKNKYDTVSSQQIQYNGIPASCFLTKLNVHFRNDMEVK